MSDEGASSEKNPVRTAIAGLGRAGWNIHAKALQKRTDFKVAAVIDQDEARRKEAEATFAGCRAYSEWKEFLKDPHGAELVIVATPSVAHGPMSIEALKAGLNVLVEKPMAIGVKEADRMIAAARKARRILTVHQNHRTDAELHQLLALVNSGLLGRVFMIKNNGNGFRRRNDWQTLRKYGGGMLNNTCPHNIDQVLQLLQSPVKDVWGDLQQCVNPGNVEDHVKILIRGKNGRVIDLEVSGACAHPQPAWLVMGSLGTLVQQGEEFFLKYLDPATLPKLKVADTPAVPERKYGVVGGETLVWNEKRVPAGPPEMAVDFYARLYDSLRLKKKLFVTPESVREVIRVIALARRGTKFP